MQEVLPKRATLRCEPFAEQAYTESKLRSKLKKGGYPQESIDSALAYVKSYHYVDDLQFARITSLIRREKEQTRVGTGSDRKGVSRDEIEAAFAEAAERGDGPDELALAQMWLAKSATILRRQTLQERKVAAFLYRKGISAENRKAMELAGERNYRGTDLCRMARNYLTSVWNCIKLRCCKIVYKNGNEHSITDIAQ
ncbi:MAG: hypothetical protein ACLURV_08145 [Gallintestinimicrobium sp.]